MAFAQRSCNEKTLKSRVNTVRLVIKGVTFLTKFVVEIIIFLLILMVTLPLSSRFYENIKMKPFIFCVDFNLNASLLY